VGERKAAQARIQKMATENEDGENTGRWRCAGKSSGTGPALSIVERQLLLNGMILDVIARSTKQVEALK
jgi:hypothetical protein